MTTDANVNAIYTTIQTLEDSAYNVLNVGSLSVNNVPSIISTKDFYTSEPRKLSEAGVEFFVERYSSLDAFACQEDGSDLGYLRVLRFKNGLFGSQVYPNKRAEDVVYPDSDVSIQNPQVYQDLIVTNLGSGLVEKAQIIKTNKTLQIYAFDSQPEVLSIQGVLKSTLGSYWDMSMVILWDNLLRASQLIQQNLIVEFGYQGNIYWGLPLNFQWQKNAQAQMLLTYSMQFLVIKRTIVVRNMTQALVANSLITQLAAIPSIT